MVLRFLYVNLNIDNHNTGDTMISKHIENEKEVILYLDFNYEIGSFNKEKTSSIISNIMNYLKNKKINVDGKKIMLVLGSTLVATFIYTNGTFKKIESNKYLAPDIVSVSGVLDLNQIKENHKKKNIQQVETKINEEVFDIKNVEPKKVISEKQVTAKK